MGESRGALERKCGLLRADRWVAVYGVILVLTGVTRPSLSSILEYDLNGHCRNDSFETWHITGQQQPGTTPLQVHNDSKASRIPYCPDTGLVIQITLSCTDPDMPLNATLSCEFQHAKTREAVGQEPQPKQIDMSGGHVYAVLSFGECAGGRCLGHLVAARR